MINQFHYVDLINKTERKNRSETQMTLGEIIDVLSALDPDRKVVGLGTLDSYRGYYSDLAFEPDAGWRTVSELLQECRSAVGKAFEGYKGGEYVMDLDTPLWLSPWGEVSGLKLIGLKTDEDPIVPVVEEEEW